MRKKTDGVMVALVSGQDFFDRVHIRCCGNGCLGFRPYGGSLFSDAKKVTKKALPHHSVPRLGSACPNEGIAPWARRSGIAEFHAEVAAGSRAGG
ncbi:hypothetical protein B1218_04115 [Pseudomonas ogarae]|nr:hypothetical protein B1218_04115 [Pseudomonas ogarae]